MPYTVRIAGESTKVTTNLGAMFKFALGKELVALDNLTGAQAYHDLWPAVAMIYRPDDIETLKGMEPKNGHGTVKLARHFLVDLLELCSDNPTEILSVEV